MYPVPGPSPVCASTPRLKKLATLEFDRDRKSMGVICAPARTAAASEAASAPAPAPVGRVTRRAAREGHSGGAGSSVGGSSVSGSVERGAGAGGNVLLVKGAAETLLARCDTVRIGHYQHCPTMYFVSERQRQAKPALRTMGPAG